MTRVCHLSSAHVGLDVRIFHKECASLAAAGYDTHLVISATEAEVALARTRNVTVHALPRTSGRISRMFAQSWRCYRIGRSLQAKIYHFHDPELIPYGILLRLSGKKVVYDVHEDLPKDILSKEWIPRAIRNLVSVAAGAVERLCARFFFSVVTATPFIAARFQRFNPDSIDVNNFPVCPDFEDVDWADKKAEICYVGNIGTVRGIEELVRAMALVSTGVRLSLCGKFSGAGVERRVKSDPGWARVDDHGFLDRHGVHRILGRAMAGVVTLHPLVNYLDALPVKMFEYMAAGIPVVASNFPKWRGIVEGSDCGICVDPLKPEAIAQAIDWLVTHPDEAKRKGRNGRRAVAERYNWRMEEEKLKVFYRRMLEKP